MHFVAMMGFTVDEAPIHYDGPITFASLAVAIVMVGIGVFIVGYRGATATALFTGGTITGLGIASMHYLGMAGMRLNGQLEYDTAHRRHLRGDRRRRRHRRPVGGRSGQRLPVERGRQPRHGRSPSAACTTPAWRPSASICTAPPAPHPGDSPAALLAPMLIGPLAFLLLAGCRRDVRPADGHGQARLVARREQARRPRARPVHSPAARRPLRSAAAGSDRQRPRDPAEPLTEPAPVRAAAEPPDRSRVVSGGSYGGSMRPVSQIERTVAPFEVVSPYQPSGDQPTAIAELARRVRGR